MTAFFPAVFFKLYAALQGLMFSGFLAGHSLPPAAADASVAAPPSATPTAAEDEKAPAAGPFGQSRLYVGF
jgi:hypothetical protein